MDKSRQQQSRAEREKRGRGERETYSPYIRVARGEFTSHGRSHQFPSPFFDRHHQLLSDLELHVLWTLQLLTPNDIREQFPLQWHSSVEDPFWERAPYAPGTVEIAKDRGIKHPIFSLSEPRRMTTDFVVELQSGEWVAIHVKYEKDLLEPRNREKFEIEKAYWNERCIPVQVIHEKNIEKQTVSNLAMALTYKKEFLKPITGDWLSDVVKFSELNSMNDVAEKLTLIHGKTENHQKHMIKYSIATGLLRLDLSKRQLRWNESWPPFTFQTCEAQQTWVQQ